MAEEKKRKPIERLQSAALIRPLVDKMYSEGIMAAREGRPVAWSMVNWWEGDLIMRAMGVTPVYPENFGTVCASTGIAQKYLQCSAAEGFPTHLCGYAQNCLGYTTEMKTMGTVPADAPMGGMVKPTFMLCSEVLCDARYKWFQSLRQFWNVPAWTVPCPQPDPNDIDNGELHAMNLAYMEAELTEFVVFLEQLLGKRMDWDRLAAMMDTMEKVFQVWWDTNALRTARPCPMHSRDFWTMMVPCLYMCTEPESLAAYQNAYEEVKARVEARVGAVTPEKYRLMFAELPPWHSLGFFDRLAERGWNFVCESPIGYHAAPPVELPRTGTLLNRLASWTYWEFTHWSWHASRKGYPLLGAVQKHYNWAIEYQIDGIVTHPLMTCRTATFWLNHAMNVLRDKLDIPGLTLQGDIVDLTVFDAAGALRQALAFEETMDHFRTVRKSKGRDW